MSGMCFHAGEWWVLNKINSILPLRGMSATTCPTCGARLEVER